MKKFTTLLCASICAALFTGTAFAQQPKTFRYSVDLGAIKNDRLHVKLELPAHSAGEVIFRFPKMVPGIYAALNLGTNVDTIFAFNGKGAALPVSRVDTNSWKIRNAAGLARIEYEVADDWEDFSEAKSLMYRSPRSSFTADSVFVINNSTLFGYVQGHDRVPVTVSFARPAHLYAATSLKKAHETEGKVIFSASSYHELVDNPVLFSRPDTAMIQLGDVPVLVACYSNSGKPIARSVAAFITPLLQAQKAYLGGKLPVDRYSFLLYHNAGTNPLSYFYDGLEHAASTLILSNMFLDPAVISRNVYTIAGHEFFHTVMPLALHSEEIENFDFSGPRMSKHLWLYEGMTEYFTMHMPVKQGIQSLPDFAKAIEDKIGTMLMFDSTLSLTDLGRQAIERQDQYMNVYMRGALACLALDILLRSESGGRYGVQHLISDLLKKYGKNRPFKDEILFADIVKLSKSSKVASFIKSYLEGPYTPPLKAYLAKAGFIVDDHYKVTVAPNPTKAQLALRKAWIGR